MSRWAATMWDLKADRFVLTEMYRKSVICDNNPDILSLKTTLDTGTLKSSLAIA